MVNIINDREGGYAKSPFLTHTPKNKTKKAKQ